MMDKRAERGWENVLVMGPQYLESVSHTLTVTIGQVGNGTNQIRIKSQAKKSLSNSIKGENAPEKNMFPRRTYD